MSELNRREFVIATAALSVAGVLCEQETWAAPANEPGPSSIDARPVTDYSKDGITDRWAAKPTRVLIIRNEGRLYAPTSTCSHKNCIVKVKAGELACPCHGSKYTLMGVPTKGPAKYPLYRYGISKNDQGHVIIDKTKQFEEKNWDDPGAFIKMT